MTLSICEMNPPIKLWNLVASFHQTSEDISEIGFSCCYFVVVDKFAAKKKAADPYDA